MRRAARLLVLNEAGEVLLVHTIKKGRNRWEFPGGKVDEGETPREAAIRETFEETGVTIRNTEYVCTRRLHTDDDYWEVWYYVACDYRGNPSLMEPEKADKVEFVKGGVLDSLPQIPRLCIDVLRFYLNGGDKWRA